jgi:tRNA (cytidine/uridine-2'-O-)-methyltransferase
MFEVVLYRPEIPPNTGNLMRLCVNTGCRLHLIHPLGFELDDTRLRRAGLDYLEFATVQDHEGFEEFLGAVAPKRVFAYTQHASTLYTDVRYQPGDTLVFGPESVGLPDGVLHHGAVTERVRIPIAAGGRSLNLANAAAIGIYEAWRQNNFATDG